MDCPNAFLLDNWTVVRGSGRFRFVSGRDQKWVVKKFPDSPKKSFDWKRVSPDSPCPSNPALNYKNSRPGRPAKQQAFSTIQ